MSVIESLKVEGNIPCPTPAASKPPLPTRRKSNAGYANPAAKPFKVKISEHKHVNTQEELRNILLQAKAPALMGPTLIAKRMGYMSKIKQLNDGMYKHHVLEEDTAPIETKHLSLEGRRVESNTKVFTEVQQLDEDEDLPHGNDTVIEIMKRENTLPHRSTKSTANSATSAKSFHSGVFSAKSDSGIQKPLTLPMLTIGANKHKTKGEYINESRDDMDLHGLHYAKPHKDMFRGEQEEYEFRFTTPRKFRFKGDLREIRTPDSTGNYGSLSLSDLKACLHVNHSNERSTHQDYIVKNYMEQLKKKRSGIKVNPYKMLKVASRKQAKNGVSPRYEFNSIESYLKFNNKKQKPAGKNGRGGTARGESQASVSDTVVLQMMSDLNNPTSARQGEQVTFSQLTARDREDLLQIKPPVAEKIRRQRQSHSDSPTPAKSDKQIIQHIVYVPSGQTAKVKLIKS